MATPHADLQAPLKNFVKTRDVFIGIDSDGCAFDTMEVKHKECFIPAFIRVFKLAAVSKYAREACEFVNLYSKDRGANRFPAYLKALDLLAARPEAKRRGFTPPPLKGLRDWVARETKLGTSTLRPEAQKTNDPDLLLALEWSQAVDDAVRATVQHVPPFPMVRESLEALQGKADAMVVSATPGEALAREWNEHGIDRFVSLIAGQEMGSKKEHLALAARDYDRDRVLMVGDAPGDRKAAEANGVLFYPIDPGHEEESWQRFHDDALPRFLSGNYRGAYAEKLLAQFDALLPEHPSWA